MRYLKFGEFTRICRSLWEYYDQHGEDEIARDINEKLSEVVDLNRRGVRMRYSFNDRTRELNYHIVIPEGLQA